MALTGTHSVGLPVVLLHECEALIITVELTNGEVCRGRLTRAEDSFNLHMNDCVMSTPDAAKDRTIDKLFIRGDRIKMIICPPVIPIPGLSPDDPIIITVPPDIPEPAFEPESPRIRSVPPDILAPALSSLDP